MPLSSNPGSNIDTSSENMGPLTGDLDQLTAREIKDQLSKKYGQYGIVWNHDEVIIEDTTRKPPQPWSADELGNYTMMVIKTRPIRIKPFKCYGYTLERLKIWPPHCKEIIEQIEAWRSSHPLIEDPNTL